MNPCIAIIEQNTFTCISLRNMLRDLYNRVEVLAYKGMEDFIKDSNHHFVHFFVNSEILFANIDEFETLKSQTTVLSNGCNRRFEDAGYSILDVCRTEQELTTRLMHLQFHMMSDDLHRQKSWPGSRGNLSNREKEVLVHIVKGMLNKEIAEKMGISLNTVIFHRNNICEKLQTRSIGRLTIFAVLSGLVEIDEI